MIRILIADDHNLFREGIISMLKGVSDIEIIAEVSNGRELVKKYFEVNPDVILTDISMPMKSGPAAIKSILHKDKEAKVLFLSQFTGDDYLYAVLKAGALGLVSKNCLKDELIFAIKEVYQGRNYFKNKSIEELNLIIKRFDDIKMKNLYIEEGQLTPKEDEVLTLIGEGLTSDQIAEQLEMSRRTVDTHRSKIMGTLGFKSFSELIRYAVLKNIERNRHGDL